MSKRNETEKKERDYSPLLIRARSFPVSRSKRFLRSSLVLSFSFGLVRTQHTDFRFEFEGVGVGGVGVGVEAGVEIGTDTDTKTEIEIQTESVAMERSFRWQSECFPFECCNNQRRVVMPIDCGFCYCY